MINKDKENMTVYKFIKNNKSNFAYRIDGKSQKGGN